MPNDLFTPHTPQTDPDPHEIWFRDQIAAANCKEAAQRRELGIVAPWEDIDGMLEADERKLLSHIADNAGRVYYGGRDRRTLATTLGYVSTGNFEAIVAKCLTRGLITITTEKHMSDDGSRDDKQRISATRYGMMLLEDWEEYGDG